MSSTLFKNSRARLQRAAHHLAEFETEWLSLIHDDPPDTVVHRDESGWFVASVVFSEQIRERIASTTLPLILGEFAYQLRSALDGLIWDTVTIKQKGTEPAANAKGLNRLDFPIKATSKEFESSAIHDFPFPTKLRQWLVSIQPYAPGKPLGDPDRGLAGALEDVHNLARFDRHRRLRVVASLPTELYADFDFEPLGDFKAVNQEGLECDFLGGDYHLMRFKVESASGKIPKKIRIQTRAKFELFFEDLVTYENLPPGKRLSNLHAAVDHVVSRFESEFDGDLRPTPFP